MANGNDDMNRTTSERASCPEDVLRMIPWYDDEALGEDERADIEAHAAECAACRNELSWMSEDASSDAPFIEAPSADAVYSRVRDQIQRDSAGDLATQAHGAASTRRAGPAADWRRLALAASVLIAVLAAFAIGRGSAGLEEPVYEVATPAAVASSLPVLDVIFEPSATAEKINGALRAIGGRIIHGPSRLGVYRVELPLGADAVAAARMLRADGEGVASLAEVGGA